MGTKKWLPITEGVAIVALVIGLFAKGNTTQTMIAEKESEIQAIQTQLDEKDAEMATTLESVESEKGALESEKASLESEKADLEAKLNETEAATEAATEVAADAEVTAETEAVDTEKDSQLAEKDSQLAEKDSQLAEKDSQLAEKDSQLTAKDEEFAAKEAEYQKQAEELQVKLEKILGVRDQMITDLTESFSDSDLDIEVDEETGIVSLDTNVLFGFDNAALTEEGRTLLDEFIPKYFDVVFSDDVKDYVSEVIIEGHTDDVGTYLYNMYMSQMRAYSVAIYCIDNNTLLSEEEREELSKILTVNGKSYSNPILDEKGEIDDKASRRVELKFRLVSDEILTGMEE